MEKVNDRSLFFFLFLFPSRSPSRRSTKRLFSHFNHRAGLSSFDRLVSFAAYSLSVRYTCFSYHETITVTVPPIHFVLFCCPRYRARLTSRRAFHEAITSFSSLFADDLTTYPPPGVVPVSLSPGSFRFDCFREFSGRGVSFDRERRCTRPWSEHKTKEKKKDIYIDRERESERMNE